MLRKNFRRLSVLTALLACLLSLAAAAGAASSGPYPPGATNGTVSTSKVTPNGNVGFSGGGYQSGSTVQLTGHSADVDLGTVVADASGAFSVTLTLPPAMTPGDHWLIATGVDPSGAPRVVSAHVTVVAAASSSPTGSSSASAGTGGGLPSTGANVLLPAVLAAAALAAGAAFLLVAARRRAGSHG